MKIINPDLERKYKVRISLAEIRAILYCFTTVDWEFPIVQGVGMGEVVELVDKIKDIVVEGNFDPLNEYELTYQDIFTAQALFSYQNVFLGSQDHMNIRPLEIRWESYLEKVKELVRQKKYGVLIT